MSYFFNEARSSKVLFLFLKMCGHPAKPNVLWLALGIERFDVKTSTISHYHVYLP